MKKLLEFNLIDGKEEERATDELLWQWKLHEDGLFNNRANFFLVAESMFFTAFAAIIVVVDSFDTFVVLPVIMGIAGILLCVIWLKIGNDQLHLTDEALRQEIEKRANEGRPFYRLADDFIKARKDKSNVSISDMILWIPEVLVGIWAFLLLSKCRSLALKNPKLLQITLSFLRLLWRLQV
jgi:hypothetical protein